MQFRTMTSADIAAVAGIEASVDDGWGEVGVAAALAAPACRCFVACEAADKALAFAAFTLVADEANLDALSVAAAYRRKGAARGLLGFAFARLAEAGARCVFLEARSQNAPALALYEALGFVVCGRRGSFYECPDDDAVIMKKSL